MSAYKYMYIWLYRIYTKLYISFILLSLEGKREKSYETLTFTTYSVVRKKYFVKMDFHICVCTTQGKEDRMFKIC